MLLVPIAHVAGKCVKTSIFRSVASQTTIAMIDSNFTTRAMRNWRHSPTYPNVIFITLPSAGLFIVLQ